MTPGVEKGCGTIGDLLALYGSIHPFVLSASCQCTGDYLSVGIKSKAGQYLSAASCQVSGRRLGLICEQLPSYTTCSYPQCIQNGLVSATLQLHLQHTLSYMAQPESLVSFTRVVGLGGVAAQGHSATFRRIPLLSGQWGQMAV